MSDRQAGDTGALQGLTVVDLTTVVMGPYATVTLGDLGADIIKVESLDGDMSRGIGASRHTGMSAIALNLQRNKQSVAVDLSDPRGRSVLDDLIRSADVLVTNLRPRSREKMGLTWPRLESLNPGLVFCTAQAYGSQTDRRDYPAYDDMVQAASGTARLAERVDGSPRYAPFVIADKVAGLYIVMGILSALVHKVRTGEGQHVDVPMVDSMVGFNLVEHFGGNTFSPPEGGFGWARVLVPERAPHRTADNWICIIPYSNDNWRDFFAIAGMTDLMDDPRFATVNDRHQHMNELLAAVHAVTPSKTTAEWLELCQANNIPASSLLDLGEAHRDEYLLSRDLIRLREHPTEGEYFSTRTPLDLSATPVSFRRHAPQLGEQTLETLRSLGYSADEIDQLLADKVIGAPADSVDDIAWSAVAEESA